MAEQIPATVGTDVGVVTFIMCINEDLARWHNLGVLAPYGTEQVRSVKREDDMI